MSVYNKISMYLSFLLRHHPEQLNLKMDKYGWVSVEELLYRINEKGTYHLNFEELLEIVEKDRKGRYRLNDDSTKIKACQGHSIARIEVELNVCEPPQFLYHGTTTSALQKIIASKAILKMERHAVHMQDNHVEAMKSAKRWKLNPVVLKIDAKAMWNDGYEFGVSENGVWCTEIVPTDYIVDKIYQI